MTTVWTGSALDNSWTNTGNWSAGLPSATNDAVFNGSAGVNLSADTQVAYINVNSGSVTITTTGGRANNSGTLTLFVNTGSSLTMSVVIATTGLTKNGAGSAILTSANTYSGITSVNDGTLTTSSGSLSQTTVISVISPGILNAVNAKSGVNVTVSGSATFSSEGGNLGSVSVNGSLTFSGTSTTWGITSLTGSGNITFLAGLTVDQSVNTLFSGTLTGPNGAFTKRGSGSLTLSSDNNLPGGVSVRGGELVAGSSGSFGSVAASVSFSGILNLASIASPARINVNDGTVANASAFTGSVGVSSIFQKSMIPNASEYVVFPGGMLYLGGTTCTASVLLCAGSYLRNGFCSASLISFTADTGFKFIDASITGSAPLYMYGAGEVTLAGQNSLSGMIYLRSGTVLRLRHDGALGTSTIVSETAGGPAAFNFIDLYTYGISNNITASGPSLNGYTKIIRGGAYTGTLTVNSGAVVQIPTGEVLNGNAVVNGTLSILGKHTGTITNSGTLELENPSNPPVNVYNGLAGSTYAVKAS
jgi:fibronectin-binding autotransporter adhesin